MKTKIYISIIALILILMPLVYATTIWSDDTSTTIIINSDKPNCQLTNKPSTTGWWELKDGTYKFTGSSLSNCYRAIVDFGSQGCCPTNFRCNNSTLPGKCVFSGAQICADYTPLGEDACKIFEQYVANYSIEVQIKKGPGFCGKENSLDSNCNNVTKCRCYWDKKTGTCSADWYLLSKCSPDLSGTCSYSTNVTNQCSDTGFIGTAWTAIWTYAKDGTTSTDHLDCKAGNSKIKCLSTTLLPFTGVTATIVVIVLIILYYILRKMKSNNFIKKKKAKKKK